MSCHLYRPERRATTNNHTAPRQLDMLSIGIKIEEDYTIKFKNSNSAYATREVWALADELALSVVSFSFSVSCAGVAPQEMFNDEKGIFAEVSVDDP